ncbi:MAG TPA: metallophosphoesterase [Thermoanaerobaculia bacterium]|nr:metallophosphoesterase [Thermoanaerobaculia bacterium]
MKRAFSRLAFVLLLVGVFLALWAFWWEPRRLVVREQTLALPCWTRAPLRIAILADLHIGSPYTGVTKLEEIVRRVNAGKPDVVVLLGDFVIQGVKGGRFVPPEAIAEKLGALRAPLGTYAVLGNHDWWLDAGRITRAFAGAGIPMLEDRAVPLRYGQNAFWLAGISDFTEGPHDVARAVSYVIDDAPVIAMTHNPDVFPLVPRRVCLTLAGHTHGGQVVVPFAGRPIVPSQFGELYAIGHVNEHGKHLFVSSGVGTSIIPVRFRVPPELVFLTVRGAR